MVSFWPFRAEDKSAAAFEKVLSSLSQRINKVSARELSFRQTHRRLRVLWTLYAGAIYIIAVLILTLVTGWSNWTAKEGAAVTLGPFIIYGVRLFVNTYFNYRIGKCQQHLDGLNKQRDETISRLKDATKYNSTQELLQKYGGNNDTPTKQSVPSPGRPDVNPQVKHHQARTGIAPPPTANIPNRLEPVAASPVANDSRPPQSPTSDIDTTADFAPNAFDDPVSALVPTSSGQPHPAPQHTWIDRVLDLVMGEDETQPKNRLALICQSCRLVNGQAPPGTRSLDEVGKWRCMACATLNGTESEAEKVIREMGLKSELDKGKTSPTRDEDHGGLDDSVGGAEEGVSSGRAGSGGAAKQRKKSEK